MAEFVADFCRYACGVTIVKYSKKRMEVAYNYCYLILR